MTGEDFINWRKSMGLNRIQAAEKLGMSRNTVTRNERDETPIPPYIAYACMALSCGLEPWESEGSDELAGLVRAFLEDKKAAA